MTKQMMFYEQVVPVSHDRHGAWSVRQGEDFGFAAEANAVPLMSAEFASAVTEYPVVFGKSGEGFTPVVVLGIEQNKSLFVDAAGRWTGAYVPAFVRRYPFVFAQSEDRASYTLCMDEAYGGCDPAGAAGQRLYGEDAKPTEFLEKALEFVRNYEVEQRRTAEYCRLLAEHDLLEPMQASMTMPDGQKRALTGFHVIPRERLKKLEGEALKTMFERDALELVYYHMASLRNMEKLRNRLAA